MHVLRFVFALVAVAAIGAAAAAQAPLGPQAREAKDRFEARVQGTVTEAGAPVEDARVTLFTPGRLGTSPTTPARGRTIAFEVFPATRLTGAVLMGVQSTTHWLDCGIPRRLELEVTQAGSVAEVDLPSDPDLLPLGWYMLFGMVDDIPSEALILRVDA